MDRYCFTSDLEHIQRILPNQMWIKKSYPNESLVILHYRGDMTYECLSINQAEMGIPSIMSASQISNHYKFSHTVDNH